MARKKVMFEINDEETLEHPAIKDEEIFSEQSESAAEEALIQPETAEESDVLKQVEDVFEQTIFTDEGSTEPLESPESETDSDSLILTEEEELFLGLSSAAEEGDTKVFEKLENEEGLIPEEAAAADAEETKENMMRKKVAGQPKKIRRKKKTKLGFNWFFWVSLVVISVPVVYFISLLVEASKVSHLPILGERVKNTIVYTISENDVSYISDAVKQLEGVESAEINLVVETLRIVVDVKDDLTAEQIEELILNIYGIVDEKIPIATYFTKDGDYKQYDLDILAYNDINSEELILINLIKNGSMEEYTIQVLSTAVNQELVDRLKDEQNPDKEVEEDPDSEEDIEFDSDVY